MSAPLALRVLAPVLVLAGAGCSRTPPAPTWQLSPESPVQSSDRQLLDRIARALDAAATAGTDPSISRFHVRAATVVPVEGRDEVVVGGNTEYAIPEAIHGEASLVNHVVARFGTPAAKRIQFIAFYAQSCGDSRGCGDCRDYMRAATAYEPLLWVCGRAGDRSIHLRRFADGLLDETQMPEVSPSSLPVDARDLDRLVKAAESARRGGVTLFTPPERHTAAAVLTTSGSVYQAAGADDAAFHYRYPVGAALQQAASAGDYFPRLVLVLGEPGTWPRVMYRDRQYGFEASSFAVARRHPPATLVLGNGEGRFRAVTFEQALPHPFSVARFNPDAIERFLSRRGQ